MQNEGNVPNWTKRHLKVILVTQDIPTAIHICNTTFFTFTLTCDGSIITNTEIVKQFRIHHTIDKM